MSSSRLKKPKMLVVDDEPDNLDLLYRTFRRDFQVLRAESGIAALEVLKTEGEVAVIISDQRMPEMKGTEFLSKTVPQFPNTMRIILTGFTDVEDLVEAINSGQVYKYITKPWDPNELKSVVQRAAETYESLKHRTEELRLAQIQADLLAHILEIAQETSTIADCLPPLAAAFGKAFGTQVCLLQVVQDGNLSELRGCHALDEGMHDWLAQDPLTAATIAEHQLQIVNDTADDDRLSGIAPYSQGMPKTHVVVPIVFRNRVLAVLSLQWRDPCQFSEDEQKLLMLTTQQVALLLDHYS